MAAAVTVLALALTGVAATRSCASRPSGPPQLDRTIAPDREGGQRRTRVGQDAVRTEPRPRPAPSPEITAPVRYRLRVTDQIDAPIAGARIELRRRTLPGEEPQGAVVATTGDDGCAEATAELHWVATVRAAGHVNTSLDVSPDVETRVVLEHAFAVSGVVVDREGRAVGGATLSVTASEVSAQAISRRIQAPWFGPPAGLAVPVTDSAGRFRIDGLRGGWTVSLTAKAPGGDTASERAEPGDTDVRLVIGPPGDPLGPSPPLGPVDAPAKPDEELLPPRPTFLRLLVCEPDGRPVAGARVAMGRTIGWTDALGVAALELADGQELVARLDVTVPRDEESGRPERTYAARVPSTPDRNAAPTRFVLPVPTPVRVVVLGDQGPLTPEDGVIVSVQSNTLVWSREEEAFAGEVSSAPSHRVFVAGGDHAPHVEEVALAAGRPNELRVRLLRAARIRGTVAPAQPRTTVFVRARRNGHEYAHDVKGPSLDGAWSAATIPPGEVDVVFLSAGVLLAHRSVSLAPGADVDLGPLSHGTLRWRSGTVRDSAGRPLGGCRVLPSLLEGAVDGAATATEGDGVFRIAAGAVHDLVVRIERRGFGTLHARLGDAPLQVTLHEAGTIRVLHRFALDGRPRVESPDGAASWTPAPFPPTEPPPAGMRAMELRDLPPGPLDVVIPGADELRGRVDVRSGETVEVRFD